MSPTRLPTRLLSTLSARIATLRAWDFRSGVRLGRWNVSTAAGVRTSIYIMYSGLGFHNGCKGTVCTVRMESSISSMQSHYVARNPAAAGAPF